VTTKKKNIDIDKLCDAKKITKNKNLSSDYEKKPITSQHWLKLHNAVFLDWLISLIILD